MEIIVNTIQKQNLVSAIDKTIDYLKGDYGTYDWNDSCKCNVGVLVQHLLDLNESDFYSLRRGYIPTWDNLHKIWLTGLEKDEKCLIKNILDTGVSLKDLADLEVLSNPKVLSRTTFETQGTHFKDKQNLISYLNAWAKILEEEINDGASLDKGIKTVRTEQLTELVAA